jgi:hypothetical protein
MNSLVLVYYFPVHTGKSLQRLDATVPLYFQQSTSNVCLLYATKSLVSCPVFIPVLTWRIFRVTSFHYTCLRPHYNYRFLE